MRLAFIGISCFCLSLVSLGQNQKIDSLKGVLLNPSTSYTEVNTLNAMSREIYLLGLFDSAIYFSQKAMDLSLQLDYKRGLAAASINLGSANMNKGLFDTANYYFGEALLNYRLVADFKGVGAAYNSLGNILLSQGDYDGAYEQYKIALKIRSKLGDRQGVADCFNNIGIINYYRADYQKALQSYLAGLKILKELGNQNGIARSYSNIGSIYLQQGDSINALESFENGLSIQQQLGDKMGMGRSYNNIASVYLYESRLDKAMENFLKALEIKEEIGDYMSIGQTYLNIGNVYYVRIGDEKFNLAQRDSLMDKAHEYYYKSLEIFTLMQDKQAMAMAYNSIGTVHVSKSEPEEALKFLNKGLGLANEVGSVNDIKLSYIGLAAADSARGDWKSAYEHRKLFGFFRDSMLNEENIRQTLEAKLNFEFEQQQIKDRADRDKTEGIYREKIKWQKYLAWTLAAIFVLVLTSLFLAFNRRRLKQESSFQQKLAMHQKMQAAVIMETQEQERKRIAEDLHDSLGQLLSTIKINLQTLPQAQQHYYTESLLLLNQASAEIRSIAFNLMPQTLEDAGLVPALYELAEKIKRSSLYEIMVQVHGMEKVPFEKQTEFNIYRIVQEAVNNIIKHAEAREITIQLVKLEDTISIMIEDDGVGFDPVTIKMSGRGLRNITARSEWLHGNITIDSRPGKGTTIFIEIPIEKQSA
ncbi:MAG: sensor histidine kinase [Bacteroidetes bacterium]|nr:sensor histidine kinase [Bacteroidota bacterium]